MDFGSGGFFYQNELYVITSMDPTINLRKLDTTNRVLREIEAFEPLTSFHFYGETALVGDTILISGGLDEHFAFQSRVDAWNITSRSWSLSKKLPNPVESHCYQGIDDKFLILAGGKTSVTEATSETYIYDISNDVYTKIADLPFPWASMSCAIVQTSTDSKTLVMSGGRKMVEIGVFEPVTDTAIFNINYDFTGNWTVIDHKLPFAIEEGTLIGAGPRAFWFGGNVFGPQPYPEQILTFDFQKGWQNFQAHPKIPSSNPVAILYPTT